MGLMSELDIIFQESLGWAEEIAVKAGVLRRCPECDEAVAQVDGRDLEPAYLLADQLIASQDELVAVFHGDRDYARAAIKATVDTTRTECGCTREPGAAQ